MPQVLDCVEEYIFLIAWWLGHINQPRAAPIHMVACDHTAGGASPRVSQPLAITAAEAGLLMSMESSPYKRWTLYNYVLDFT